MSAALDKLLADNFTPQQLVEIADFIAQMPPEEQAEIAESFARYDNNQQVVDCRDNFLPFVRRMWNVLIGDKLLLAKHHEILSDVFERVAAGTLKRVIINLPPRSTKSEFGSFLFPAWLMGRFPGKQIIQATHTASLSYDFGAKVRNLMKTEEYQEVFPDVQIAADKKAAGRWNTNRGGRYFAVGIGGSIAGRGADYFILDDPLSERQALDAVGKPDFYDKQFDWFTSGPLQRLQPNAAVVILMTRWSKIDISGRLIDKMIRSDDVDRYEVIQVPALLPSGSSFFPEMWPTESMLERKANIPLYQWNAQFQQDPTSEEAALVKREWWKQWNSDPPKCEFIIQSWDTAMSKTERSNYSACTTWGVFYMTNEDGKEMPQLILLDALAEKLEFPALKRRAMEMWREWMPDAFIVEKKTSGISLIAELRQIGIPVQEFVPSRGNDKIARVNAISDLFCGMSVIKDKETGEYRKSGGIVWAPPRRWAEEVIEQFAAFPNGENDDYVDSSTAALLRFRQGGFIRLESDEEDKRTGGARRSDYY